ncbi:tetraspanin-5-like [Eurytemora carolleeae]|uniref:tetraspanin-5-like n=1 Tax=Eurytemora carolleeae TaxID=1294199 RepID=UPI000C788BDA|nr:tetraspanin-5-like [Eurytemora carolleeae]|eukprot:XP_023331843.1 tetraspanin-5-like [Eurytemora affinis]
MSPREQAYRERAVAPAPSSSRRRRIPEGFTYISSCVKYTMFFFNFLFWMCGLLLIAVGIYATLDKWSNGEVFNLKTIYDVMFNIGFLFIIIGGVVCIVSFAGCIGSLRENMFLLKFYSFCLLIFFLAEMTLMALAFIYPHKLTEFLENELSEKLIASYRDDLDFQNLIDLVQQDFECCGISSNGYRDWSKNEYFNCTTKEDNPSVERCGVPYSCCHKEPNDVLVNFMCGFEVQEMKEVEDVVRKINTEGCIPAIQALIEGNLYPVGGIAIGIALSQLFVIWLSRTLEGQIESQKSLWTIQ